MPFLVLSRPVGVIRETGAYQARFDAEPGGPTSPSLAYDGDAIAGFTTTGKRQSQDAYTWMTGVGRNYQGRAWQPPLKSRRSPAQKAKGLREMLMTNDEPNKAMRESNAKRGYRTLPAQVQLERPLLH